MAKRDNQSKIIIVTIIGLLVIVFLYFGYNLRQAHNNGSLSAYISQKVNLYLAKDTGNDVIVISANPTQNAKQIYAGYVGTKYYQNGKVESGTFYFNGNFEPFNVDPKVNLWNVLFGLEKK